MACGDVAATATATATAAAAATATTTATSSTANLHFFLLPYSHTGFRMECFNLPP